jgi:bacterial/archaeal transporter family-2 protein
VNTTVAVAAMVTGGAAAALQAPLNAGLSRATGALPAALVSFAVGTAVLTVVAAVTGELAGLRHVGDVAPGYLLGGVVGAVYVVAALAAVSRLGAGALASAVITGQLTFAVLVVDRLGLLGIDAIPVSAARVAGVLLLVVGTVALVSR